MSPVMHVPVQLRFGDIDAYQHVNNVVFVQYLEDARIQMLHAPLPEPIPGATTFGDLVGEEVFLLVGRNEIEYRAPLSFRPAPVQVSVWVTALGTASVDFGYRIGEPDGGTTYALAATTLISVSRSTGQPVPLTAPQRQALAYWQGEPVPFRRATPPAPKAAS